MRLPRVRFTMWRMMVAVAIVSLILVAIPPIKGINTYIMCAYSPFPVEGEVNWVDSSNDQVLLTIGSDDGLVVGHLVSVYRSKSRARSLGMIRITSTDPDEAEGKFVRDWSNFRVKVRVGDRVSLGGRRTD
jgi:hypothetical protein